MSYSVLRVMFCRRGIGSWFQRLKQNRFKVKEMKPVEVWTHRLRDLVHAFHGGSPAVIQEKWLLPVVVVCLQDVPAAQLWIEPETEQNEYIHESWWHKTVTLSQVIWTMTSPAEHVIHFLSAKDWDITFQKGIFIPKCEASCTEDEKAWVEISLLTPTHQYLVSWSGWWCIPALFGSPRGWSTPERASWSEPEDS